MSQAKVNKYKEDKANRKQIMQKEKRNRVISRIIVAVICLAAVCWIGYSAVDSITTKIETAQTEVDLSAVDNYLNSMYETGAETTAEE